MTEEQRTVFRRAILRALNEAHPLRLKTSALFDGLCNSFAASLEDLNAELHDLQAEGFTTRTPDTLNAAVILWGRTEKARVLLASAGLA